MWGLLKVAAWEKFGLKSSYFYYLFLCIWLHWVLAAEYEIYFLDQGLNPGLPVLGVQSLTP